MSSLKPTVMGLSIAMPILASVAVYLRFQVRLARKQPLGADDYLILIATVFCYALSGTTIASVVLGNLGGHLELGPNNIPADLDEFTVFSQTSWILAFVCIPALGLTKLSVLFFYKRIFVSRNFTAVTWFAIAMVVAWTISLFFVNFLVCLPLEINWRPQAGASGRCIDIAMIFWLVNMTDIVTDAFILMIPGPQIWALQMTTVRKLQITAIFGLGWFVVGSAIARTVLSAPGATSQTTNLDYTCKCHPTLPCLASGVQHANPSVDSRAPSVYWLVVEANVAVISACLPTIRPNVMAPKLASFGSSIQRLIGWSSASSSSSRSWSKGRSPGDGTPRLNSDSDASHGFGKLDSRTDARNYVSESQDRSSGENLPMQAVSRGY